MKIDVQVSKEELLDATPFGLMVLAILDMIVVTALSGSTSMTGWGAGAAVVYVLVALWWPPRQT